MGIYFPHSKYFEGDMQLRDPTPELIKWVYDTTKHDAQSIIMKEKKVPGGVDLFFTNQHYMQALAKKMKQKFFGELKITSTLHTEKRGEQLFRITAMFRFHKHKKGEEIEFKGERYTIETFGNIVGLKEVKSGAKKRVCYKEFNAYCRN